MAQVEPYAELIKRVLRQHAANKPSYGDIVTEVIFDDAQGHYEVMYAGWIGDRRVHGSAIHVDLRDGKIWIQHDGIAAEFLDAGVPQCHIVLAFHAPDQRKHTPFAVAEAARTPFLPGSAALSGVGRDLCCLGRCRNGIVMPKRHRDAETAPLHLCRSRSRPARPSWYPGSILEV